MTLALPAERRRTDPRQQSFWPHPSSPPPEEAALDAPKGAGYALPASPPAGPLTPVAAETGADHSEELADVERTAQILSRLLALLRQLKERAEATAPPTHDFRILSGDSQTSAQDANNDLTQGSSEDPRELRDDAPRNRTDVSESDARTTPRPTRRPPADQEEER